MVISGVRVLDRGGLMKEFLIKLPDEVAVFYTKIANNCNLPVEQVLEDSLFELAGELSLRALASQETKDDNSLTSENLG
jgi:hypothetical protein